MKNSNEEDTIAYYNKWVQRMRDEIPAEKLLIHESKDGWEPLCKFLGIDDVPNEPYPRVNDTKQMQDMVKSSVRFCNMCYFGLPAIIAAAAAFAHYKYGPFY